MSGLDKILEHINTDATNTANELIQSAKDEAAKILAGLKDEATAKANAIDEQSKVAVETAKSRIASAADQKEKRMILEAKQGEIDKVINTALEKMQNLDDKSYFDTIVKMVEKYAHAGKEGIISFSAKDLARLPKDFIEQLQKAKDGAKLEIAKEPADIKSGFLLSYGDIEENCSFDALIEASRETLQDKIGQQLFG